MTPIQKNSFRDKTIEAETGECTTLRVNGTGSRAVPWFEDAHSLRRCSPVSKVRILENPGDFFEDAQRFPRCALKTEHLRKRFFGNMARMMAESRTKVFWLVALVEVIAFAASIEAVRADSPSLEGIEFFEKKVRPILVDKCQKCHGSQRQKGGLRLDSRQAALKGGETGPVIVSGHPEKSELVKAVNYEADGFQMPPTGKLDADSISVLTDWVRRGAALAPDHVEQFVAGLKVSIQFCRTGQALVVSTVALRCAAARGRGRLGPESDRRVPRQPIESGEIEPVASRRPSHAVAADQLRLDWPSSDAARNR